MTRRVSIDMDHRGLGSIHVDGHDLSLIVSGTEITSRPGNTTEIKLTLLAGIRAEMDAEISIDKRTRELLERLGWTPPEVTP